MLCYKKNLFSLERYHIFMMKEQVQFQNGKNLEIIQLNSFATQIKWAINDDQGIPIFHVLLNNKWKKFQIDPQQGKLLKQFLNGKVTYRGINNQYKIVKYQSTNTLGSVKYYITQIVRMRFVFNEELVTCKIIQQRKPNAEIEFQNEVNSLQQLKHRNITRMREFFKEKSHNYIIYDFVEGSSLEKYIKKKLLDEEQIKKIIQDLLETIEYIHSQGYSHQDIKLENIYYCSVMNQLTFINFGKTVELNTLTSQNHVNSYCEQSKDYIQLLNSASSSPRGCYFDKDQFDCGLVIYQLQTQKILSKDDLPSFHDTRKKQDLLLTLSENQKLVAQLLTQGKQGSPLLQPELDSPVKFR